jgi:hypothetical protein
MPVPGTSTATFQQRLNQLDSIVRLLERHGVAWATTGRSTWGLIDIIYVGTVDFTLIMKPCFLFALALTVSTAASSKYQYCLPRRGWTNFVVEAKPYC